MKAMRKTSKMIIAFALVAMMVAGCGNNEKNAPVGTNIPKEYQNLPNEYNANYPNGQNTPSQGGRRQPGENQVADYAGGFSIKKLENALRKTGAITAAGEPYDVSGTNMTTATRYGNIAIGTYKEELVDEALAYYQKGKMQIQGKEVKVVNMIGNFLLLVLEGEISQESIAAFSAVGGL